MTRENIVLLGTKSRDSRSKWKHYADAAHEIGLEVRPYPDEGTLGVIACSDFKVLEAAWLCKLHGIPGPDPLAAMIATHKSLAYQFLASRGFRTLFWMVPIGRADLSHKFDRPVIVKPEYGSGSFARHPWGYRVFASVAAFRRYLSSSRQLDAFLRYQARPQHDGGRYILMEYVNGDNMYGVACAIGDIRVDVYDAHEMGAMSGSGFVDRILFGEKHADMSAIGRIASAFAEAGLRRSILYVQCVERAGRLLPIDFNLRPGTMFDLAVGALGLPFYRDVLAFLIGRKERLGFCWSSKLGVRRLYRPLRPGKRKVVFGPGCISLIDSLSYNPKRPYDLGHAWPIFAVTCTGRRDFDRRAREVIARTKVRQV